MKFSLPLVVVSATLVVACGVHAQGNQGNQSNQDLAVLQYALTLEHLEYAFYRDGLALLENNGTTNGTSNSTNTNGTSSGGITIDEALLQHLEEIRDQEKAHVQAIEAAITAAGGQPVQECEYDFGIETPEDFINLARILENVGTSAYIGSAFELTDKRLLTASASIATVEARHAAYLNQVNNVSPFPTAFDSPLDMQSVIGLVSGFISNCSNGQALPVEPRAQLQADPLLVPLGGTVNVTTDALSSGNSTNNVFCVFYAASASANSTLESDEPNSGSNSTGNGTTSFFCRVPDNAYLGDTFLFLSRSGVYTLDDTEPIIAGPALVYVAEQLPTGT